MLTRSFGKLPRPPTLFFTSLPDPTAHLTYLRNLAHRPQRSLCFLTNANGYRHPKSFFLAPSLTLIIKTPHRVRYSKSKMDPLLAALSISPPKPDGLPLPRWLFTQGGVLNTFNTRISPPDEPSDRNRGKYMLVARQVLEEAVCNLLGGRSSREEDMKSVGWVVAAGFPEPGSV